MKSVNLHFLPGVPSYHSVIELNLGALVMSNIGIKSPNLYFSGHDDIRNTEEAVLGS